MENKRHFLLKKLLGLSLTIIIIAGGLWATSNYRYLLDIYAQKTSSPGSLAQAYSDKLFLTNNASLMLYGAYPAINNKEDFNKECRPPENVIELGCYKTGINRIHVLDINEPNLETSESVTMAHELLHIAYSRLNQSEKKSVNSMVEKELSKLQQDTKLTARLKNYEITEPGSQDNELHSIIATEYMDISQELEDYYKKYFTNRKQIVQWNMANENYISGKEALIQQQKQTIETLQAQLKNLETRMDTLEKSNQINKFNSLVPQQNALVEKLKVHIEKYNNDVTTYNDIISSLNSNSYSSFDSAQVN